MWWYILIVIVISYQIKQRSETSLTQNFSEDKHFVEKRKMFTSGKFNWVKNDFRKMAESFFYFYTEISRFISQISLLYQSSFHLYANGEGELSVFYQSLHVCKTKY